MKVRKEGRKMIPMMIPKGEATKSIVCLRN